MAGYKIGYSRVSTSDQSHASQENLLHKAGVDKIYLDTYTGSKASRPELDKMLSSLRDGDTVVVTRLDRLGRSAKDLLALSSELEVKGVNLRVIEQSIDTSTAEGKLFFTIISAMAEFERSLISARTRDGLEAARARGRKGGRKPVMTKAKQETAKAMYSSGKYVSEIAQVLGVSRPTVYKALNQDDMATA
jgi:DNA invertase Pin-like site-specific DNA recombinase